MPPAAADVAGPVAPGRREHWPVPVPSASVRNRRHELDHLLLWQLRGSGSVTAEGRRVELAAGQALWLPAGVRHDVLVRDNSAMFPVLFDAQRADPDLDRVVVLEIDDALHGVLLALVQSQNFLLRGSATLEDEVLGLVGRRVARPVGPPLPRSAHARQIAETLLRSPGDARSVQELAAAAHVSVRTIERAFIAETGRTLREWRREVRMEAAAARLRAGDPPGRVAAHVGYGGASAFHRAFRAHFGRSPGEYARDGVSADSIGPAAAGRPRSVDS